MTGESYDVVVSGASIAGCTAAVLYGRAGLRVAVVERNRAMDSYKAMCGHFILGGAKATLERLGLWDRMLAEGAAVSRVSLNFDGLWVHPDPDDATVPPAISLRRSRLDPMLRQLAAETPGVDLFMGQPVTGVVEDGRGRVTGLRTPDHVLTGRLVVGADGHRSPTAGFAGVPEDTAPNDRFLWWAYYRGVKNRAPGTAHAWQFGLNAAVVVPADDGLTLVGAFLRKEHAAEFAADRVAAIERVVSTLPDGPDLSEAERVSPATGTSDYPFVRRSPVPRPGLALVGDAATASDPVPAVGCSWAFRTGEWLAEATAAALASGDERALQAGLRRYAKAHKVPHRYDKLARTDAVATKANPVQGLVMRAAARDRETARRVGMFAMRAAAPTVLLNPMVVARSLLVAARS